MGKQQALATWTWTLKEGVGTFNLPKGNITGNNKKRLKNKIYGFFDKT